LDNNYNNYVSHVSNLYYFKPIKKIKIKKGDKMKRKMSKKDLITNGWYLRRRTGKNAEIWQRDKQLLMWNSCTLKIYKII